MMRVMWLSNKLLSDHDSGSTGTWLNAMADGLVSSGQIELANVSMGKFTVPQRCDCGSVYQYAIPYVPNSQLIDGRPPSAIIQGIRSIINSFEPDLVHVWGVENYWGVLTGEQVSSAPVLLTLQGIKGAISQVFAGGLSWREQLACVGLKELLRGNTIFQQQRNFQKWGATEEWIISKHNYIHLHSAWQEAHVKKVQPNAKIYYTDLPLRTSFYKALPWSKNASKDLFCSAAYPSPFKGLHVAVRALAQIRDRHPNTRLRIAGLSNKTSLRRDGYIAWLIKEIDRLGLKSVVDWLGPLNAEQIVENLQSCAAFVLPTYIESYPVTLLEALRLGVPSVASFTGGIPSMAQNEYSALLFTPGDDVMCAYQLDRLLTDRELAESLSGHARMTTINRSDYDKVVEDQIQIYRSIA